MDGDNTRNDEDCNTLTLNTYYLRKRPKIQYCDAKDASRYVHSRSYKRKNPIMFMPTEVLQKILSFLTNEELAKNVRLVNRRFRIVAQFLLNSNFIQLKNRLGKLKKMITASMHHTLDDMELRCMCKMLGVLEILMFHHSLLTSTIWRYIQFKRNTSNICMYGGAILDLFNTVLREFLTEPHKIYSPAILRDYSMPTDVKTICNSSKNFALYFDRVTEMPLNDCGFCTGCKVLDILDAGTDVQKTVVSQKLVGNTISLQLKYYFSNSWFVALDIDDEKPKLWKEQQRLMYMRLRRIVMSHSEMSMEYNQFKRECTVRTAPTFKIRKPINSVYTGYGEVGEKFFYYGVMNEGAYINKFVLDDSNANSSVETIEDKVKSNYLGLDIYVNVICPIQLAPYTIIEDCQKDIPDFIDTKYILAPKRRLRGLFELKVDFVCPAASYPRLPTTFRYYVRNQR